MDKLQAQNIIKQTFENPFNKERFIGFIKNLLNHIKEAPFTYQGQYIPEAYRGYIQSLERIGKYEADGSKIDILIIKLQKNTSLERARTMQRNFVAWYLNGSRGGELKDAALVAYVAPGDEDWRFSLVKMDYKFTETKTGRMKVKEEFTPARRWSFLVGTNEKSHTAQSRLVNILAKDEESICLAMLEDAFNIEKVTKEFFEKYRELFLRTKETLEEIVKKDPVLKKDFTEKNVSTVDFCKKLLGQIVFLYFLQKKGWFGVPMNKKWGEGDKKFLRTLFDRSQAKNKNYFNDYLEPLFYEALARERDDDFYSRFECKIPFLNGGLFDPISNYDWVNTVINLEDEIFSNQRKTKEGDIGDGILDVFDRYNFTVKEDEPLEKEVAVDPEMLGKVFENLLEVKDRKSKGTYYTPREIVHYMCEQSLINYLATELKDKVNKESLEQFVKYSGDINEQSKTDYPAIYADNICQNAKLIDALLADIKVCDPAIGSGAFPVGMMSEIVKVRVALNKFIKEPERTVYRFKRNCIQSSLYGVDIEPGAVEIAKLRLWLSLIVDEDDIKQIKPLPNLDYKIMQGNSLLEEFEGVKLFDEKLITSGLDQRIQINTLKQRQEELQREYLHPKNKLTERKKAELEKELEVISKQIKKLNKPDKNEEAHPSLFDTVSEAKKKADELKLLHKNFFEATQKKEKDAIKNKIEQLEWELIEATLKEQNKTSELKKLAGFKKSNTKPFFLWKLNFSEVFQEKGGFDVVMANPPYGIVFDNKLKRSYEIKFDSFLRNNDIYVAFYEHSLNILKNNGSLVYITPNTFLNGDYFKKVRQLIISKTKIGEIIDYKEFPIFADPTVFVSILSCIKSDKINYPYSYTIKTPIDSIENLLNNVSEIITSTEVKLKSQNFILNKILNTLKVDLLDNRFYIKDVGFNYWTEGKGKKRDGNSIGDRVLYGGEKKHNKDIAFLKGRDIQKFYFRKPTNYLKYDYDKYLNKKIDTFRFSEDFLKMKPKLIYRQTSDHIVATIDYEANYLDKTVHLIVPKANNDLDIKFILAILNSTLADYLYRYISQEREGRTFSQVKTTYIKQIPIPLILHEEQRPFIEIVDKILSFTKATDYLTNSEKQAKVQQYEKQIDKMVFTLYGIKPEEIQEVKNNKQRIS